MKKCECCGRTYTNDEVDETLYAMFGVHVDEDYWVIIYGLCPRCWPEYS